jgi:hypothetical protein
MSDKYLDLNRPRWQVLLYAYIAMEHLALSVILLAL